MSDGLALMASAVLAHIGTNLDNLLALVALLPGLGRNKGIAAWIVAQSFVILIAWGVAEGAEHIVGAAVGWLGLVPLTMGLHGVWGLARPTAQADPTPARVTRGFFAAIVMFLAMSGDSLAVFVPLLADTAEGLEPWVLLGAGLSGLGMAATGFALQTRLERMQGVSDRVERLLPFLMIAVGLYVLWNTATD